MSWHADHGRTRVDDWRDFGLFTSGNGDHQPDLPPPFGRYMGQELFSRAAVKHSGLNN